MQWNLDDSRPIWPQIKEKLMMDIVAGNYEPGESFPTVRDLAADAKVNRNTMQRALSELENEGLVVSNRTAGRTVTSDEQLIKETKRSLAKMQVHGFLEQMEQLGFDAEETIDIIRGERK